MRSEQVRAQREREAASNTRRPARWKAVALGVARVVLAVVGLALVAALAYGLGASLHATAALYGADLVSPGRALLALLWHVAALALLVGAGRAIQVRR